MSKLIADVKKGKKISVGAYGKPEVMIVPISKATPVVFGALKGKLTYDNSDFVGADTDVQKMFYGE